MSKSPNYSLYKSFRPSVLDGLAVLVAVGLWFTKGSLTADPGVGWHLKLGELLLQGQAPVLFDPFIDHSERPWIHNQWLADLIFYFFFWCFGWYGIHATTCSLLFLAFWLTPVAICVRAKMGTLASGVAIFFCGLIGGLQWFTRPLNFSFLFFALTLYLVGREDPQHFSRIPRRLLWMPVVFILWSNTHPAFVLGLVVLAWWSLLAAVVKSECYWHQRLKVSGGLLGLFLLCFVATLCNPYGPALYSSILQLGGSDFFMTLNEEWFSPDFHNPIFFHLFVFLLLVFILLTSKETLKKVGYFDLGLLALFIALSLMQRRYAPFLAIVAVRPLAVALEAWVSAPESLPFLSRCLSHLDPRPVRMPYTGIMVFFFCGLLATSLEPSRFDPPRFYPYNAVAQLRDTSGKVFHSPNNGGFITWMLFPEQRATIDDRNLLHGAEAYESFFRVWEARPQWELLIEPYRWALIDPHAPLRHALKSSPDWAQVESEASLFRRIR